jgi:DNA-nicking Smr family endonuclease
MAALSPQDLELFHRVVADVHPLRSTPVARAAKKNSTPESSSTKTPVAKPPPSKTKQIPVKNAVRFPAALAEHIPGRVPGVDRRTALRLKRGQTEIDGRIDLHGMTQEHARAALSGFVTAGYRRGDRALLVITGKGRRNGGDAGGRMLSEPGVLRRMVPVWLSEAPMASCIVAYSPAQLRHGGTGALYILLKRRRPT